MKHADSLYTILRGMIRQEIDQTPGFRELTSHSDLPANEHAERTILGAVLLDNDAMPDMLAADYCLESHRKIFSKMVELRGHSIDIVTLAHELGEQGVKEIGGVAYLASLTEGLPRRPVIEEYVKIVQEKAKLRRIMAACMDAIKACQEQRESASDVVGKLGVALKGIRKGSK